MRLWHKDLIPVLPRQQLIAQWRECCCIARNIAVNGTPNHILVNKIMDYPIEHFIVYSRIVGNEMIRRGYKCDFNKFDKYKLGNSRKGIEYDKLFKNWHNARYFWQCVYNLQEKFDCEGIGIIEWEKIKNYVKTHYITE